MTHSMMTDTATGAGRSVADVLDAAADLLSKPGAWTQGAYARDADGNDLVSNDDGVVVPLQAVCFCLYGAVAYVEGETISESKAGQFLEGLNVSAIEWNDDPERTQDEVVAKLREAAQASRQEQQKEGGK